MNDQLSPNPPPSVLIRRHGYSDRPSGLRPVPLGLSISVTGALFAAYLFAPQAAFDALKLSDPIITENVPLAEPPPVEKPQPKVESQQPKTDIFVPQPLIVPRLPANPPIGTTDPSADNRFTVGPIGDTIVIDPPARPKPPPAPVLTKVSIDPRFADRFQPDYPPSMIRSEREGVAKVRVLVGADGRVRDVVDVGSSASAFFDATRRHALRAWRFKPATRDGRPFESWHVMSVTFTLTG